MRLFVTGGAGFIGSNFIRYWLKKHPRDRIVNFDKLTYAGNLDNLKDIEKNRRLRFIRGDISNPKDVKAAIAGAEEIIHFAAETHVDRSILAPAAFIQTNVAGTQVLLSAALKHKIKRFHHISTDEVFGQLPLNSSQKFNENTPYNPNNPYSASKAAADHLVRAYYHTYKLPITISNCSNNFGPFQFPEKFIPLAVTNLLENKKVPIYSNGNHVRDWLYVEDHCRAIELILQKGKIGDTYLIGGNTSDISNIEVVKMICEIMNKNYEQSVKFITDRPGHDLRYAIDWSKTRTQLGWKPRFNFRHWLEITVNWYSANRNWWQKIKLDQYRKYYQKQYENRQKVR